MLTGLRHAHERASERGRVTPARRRLALLGGTTTTADCLLALGHLLAGRRLIRGSAIARYETQFARRAGVRYAYSFSSGRVALYGLLKALGVGEGDEVVLQAPTHIVVANAIRYTGARPVYADCERTSYNLDVDRLESLITPRTRVIVLQHTFGIPADLDRVLALARRHGIEVIEDCVHALGATYRDAEVGGLSRAGFFSTEETKIISTTMGGMATTDDPDLAERMRAFQDRCAWPSRSLVARYLIKLSAYHVLTLPAVHRFARALYEAIGQRHPLPRPTTDLELRGERPPYYEQRLSNAQASVASRQLRRLDENLAHRRRIAAAYRELLGARGFHTVEPLPDTDPAWVRYPVWVDDREAAVRALAPYAVAGTWFTSVLEESTGPTAGDYAAGSCPVAELAARHLINLPTHPRVRLDDAERIAKAVPSPSASVGS